MTFEDYTNQRNALYAAAQAALAAGNTEECEKITAQISQLDSDFEASSKAQANLNALSRTPAPMAQALSAGTSWSGAAVLTEEGAEAKAKADYKTAWLMKMQGRKLTADQEAIFTNAIDSGDVTGIIPEELADNIITKMKQMVPLLNEITLFHVPGTMKFAVEGTIADATLHTENAEISASDDTVSYITLSTYEIVKLIRISATVKLMAISAFETWITEEIARSIAYKIEGYLVSGTGSSQPAGVDSITWTSGTNGVQWAGAALVANEIMTAISLLPARCDRNAKMLMNKKTLWTDVQKLRDDSKYPLLQKSGDGWMLLGYPVILSDFCDDHDIFLGDFKQIYANLPQDISVESSAASGFTSNSIDYRGVANFDSKIGTADAFVKISNAL